VIDDETSVNLYSQAPSLLCPPTIGLTLTRLVSLETSPCDFGRPRPDPFPLPFLLVLANALTAYEHDLSIWVLHRSSFPPSLSILPFDLRCVKAYASSRLHTFISSRILLLPPLLHFLH
jgi:hypothetical protein